MQILLIEPYFGGSHRVWAENYQRLSRHTVKLLTLPAQFWKWRMQGGAVTLARMYHEQGLNPDVILASDMFDLSLFRALTRKQTADKPVALYFHENQLTYPLNARQSHGWQYGFINYASALSADWIFFNSQYHLDAFFDELPRMLKHFGDFNELETIGQLRERSSVLPPGVDLRRFDPYWGEVQNEAPLILWNHRWDEDKNPGEFFAALAELAARDVSFQVALVGENVRQKPDDFEAAREWLGHRVIRYGYVEDFADYARLLWQADYVVSTAYQEFFGIAVVEAIYCGCIPILPRRLNYPYLIPAEFHSACLYPDDKLLTLLLHHFDDTVFVDVPSLQKHIARYDWAMLVERYDHALEALLK